MLYMPGNIATLMCKHHPAACMRQPCKYCQHSQLLHSLRPRAGQSCLPSPGCTAGQPAACLRHTHGNLAVRLENRQCRGLDTAQQQGWCARLQCQHVSTAACHASCRRATCRLLRALTLRNGGCYSVRHATVAVFVGPTCHCLAACSMSCLTGGDPWYCC